MMLKSSWNEGGRESSHDTGKHGRERVGLREEGRESGPEIGEIVGVEKVRWYQTCLYEMLTATEYSWLRWERKALISEK